MIRSKEQSAIKAKTKTVIGRVLRFLPDRVVARVIPPGERFDPAAVPDVPPPPSRPVRLFIAPSNMAGQGWAWARAAERIEGVGAVSMASPRKEHGIEFPADVRVPFFVYRWSSKWNRELEKALFAEYTHVLIESGRPVFGDALGRSWVHDVNRLRNAGVRVGLVFHGSDIRLPSRHAAASTFSPFHDDMNGLTTRLEAVVLATARDLSELHLPIYVSTPDQLIDVPHATWLPVVVDAERWKPRSAPFSTTRVPTVVHVPSRASLKGSTQIDKVMGTLADEGVINYRRLSGVSSESMPAIITDADIVVDQLTMGIYGVAACEAMAAGRVVVSEVSCQVRRHVREVTGLDLPIVDASADTIGSVVRSIVANPGEYLDLAVRGPEFVKSVHDGTRSTDVLRGFLL